MKPFGLVLIVRLTICLLAVFLPRSPLAEPLTVAAAASLQLALRDVGAAYRASGGEAPVLVFGASGSLARQIEYGAPYDMFASADRAWLVRLVEQGLIAGDSLTTYAEGVLALVVRNPDALAGRPAVLQAAHLTLLMGSDFRVVALANPTLAPYGIAAREALQKAGLWDAIQPRLAFGDNVRHALTYVETGNADAALVATSLLQRPDGKPVNSVPGNWRPLAASLHAPIRQMLGIVASSRRREEARRFAAFLVRGPGRDLLRGYGFRVPEIPQR